MNDAITGTEIIIDGGTVPRKICARRPETPPPTKT